MKINIGILIVSTFLISCAPVRYFTYCEGGHDPLFQIDKTKTIGFIPLYWTNAGKSTGLDALVEKQLFVYARDELQKRGYTVVYISPENLEEDSDTSTHLIKFKESYKELPDLTLMTHYWQGLGNKVQVPGQSSGVLNWSNSSGGGYYGQTQGYEVQTYFLVLQYILWSGAPNYLNKAWEGTLKKGSPKLDLFEQAPSMTSEIFERKFDQ